MASGSPSSRPGVARAALVGVGILLFGPVVAPFTTFDFEAARATSGSGSQTATGNDADAPSIVQDAWSLSSSFFLETSMQVKIAQDYAHERVMSAGWDEGEFLCLVKLWDKESHWNVHAHNAASGAYGIPQALPGSKMGAIDKDWRDNPRTQVAWGIGYIVDRYDTPCKAWKQSEREGWY